MEDQEILDKDLLNKEIPGKKTIKHIVIPGGGGTGYIAYGALRESHAQGLWKIEDIESIYGTSIGAVFAVVLSLKYEWQILDDYLIKRPWHQVFDFNMYSIINSFQKQGMFDIKLFEEMFSPLFRGVDLSLSITMKELYDFSKIDVHLYATELGSFKSIDISHKTHPDWRVIDAAYASSALPLLVAPLFKDGKYYMDGGMFLNYPIYPCIQNGADVDEILGISRKEISPEVEFSDKSTLFDYILLIFNKALVSIMLNNEINTIHVPNEIEIECYSISMYDLYMLATSQEERIRFIEKGVKSVIPKPY